jgi:hypothetical protein
MSISAISQFPTSTTSECRSTLDDIKNNLCDTKRWLYLIPVVGSIAIGILCAPNFALGLAAGGALWVVGTTINTGLSILCNRKDNSKYTKEIINRSLEVALLAPVIEELIFRGGMQPLFTRAIVWLVPAATAVFFGTGLGTATVVSIVVTSVLFGLLHLANKDVNENVHFQVIYAGILGIPLGILAVQFGLGTSIAAHIIINTISTIFANLVYKSSETAVSESQTQQLIRV